MSTLRVLVMFAGAGYGGSYLYNNREHVESIARNVVRSTVHEMSRPRDQGRAVSGGGSGGGGSGGDSEKYDSALAELASQVNRLTAQVAQGKQSGGAQQPAVMVVARGSNDSGYTLHFVISVGLVLMIVTSVVLRRRGVTWSSVVGITQAAFRNSMDTMQRGLASVSSAVRSVKEDLVERIWRVEEKMQNANREIKAKIEAAVGDARRSVDDVGTQVEKLQGVVSGLDDQFTNIDDSMQFAVRGVFMLCSYVAELGNMSPQVKGELGRFLAAPESEAEAARLAGEPAAGLLEQTAADQQGPELDINPA